MPGCGPRGLRPAHELEEGLNHLEVAGGWRHRDHGTAEEHDEWGTTRHRDRSPRRDLGDPEDQNAGTLAAMKCARHGERIAAHCGHSPC